MSKGSQIQFFGFDRFPSGLTDPIAPIGRISRHYWRMLTFFLKCKYLFSIFNSSIDSFVDFDPGLISADEIICYRKLRGERVAKFYIYKSAGSIYFARRFCHDNTNTGNYPEIENKFVKSVFIESGDFLYVEKFITGTRQPTFRYPEINHLLEMLYNRNSIVVGVNDYLQSKNYEKLFLKLGTTHGDFAAYNIIRSDNALVLVDWEASVSCSIILYDLIYFWIADSSAIHKRSTYECLLIIREHAFSFMEMIGIYLDIHCEILQHDLPLVLNSIIQKDPDDLYAKYSTKLLNAL